MRCEVCKKDIKEAREVVEALSENKHSTLMNSILKSLKNLKIPIDVERGEVISATYHSDLNSPMTLDLKIELK